jgi:hypothetical protein
MFPACRFIAETSPFHQSISWSIFGRRISVVRFQPGAFLLVHSIDPRDGSRVNRDHKGLDLATENVDFRNVEEVIASHISSLFLSATLWETPRRSLLQRRYLGSSGIEVSHAIGSQVLTVTGNEDQAVLQCGDGEQAVDHRHRGAARGGAAQGVLRR